jgi:RimJ/RimL family protein N-acetyltransferase
MQIKKATINDLHEIIDIYAKAREYMISAGNPEQWKNGYPNESLIISDIKSDCLYVCEDSGEIIATFYFKVGEDATYKHIFEGEWKNSLPYAVIHRIAVKYQGRGLVKTCFDYCYGQHKNLKIDTHRDNLPMQKALSKNGFEYCGIIYLENGEERMAYQKTK